MPSSPSKPQKQGIGGYKPAIARTCGQRPACLVNASVTYCGNNTIYAFGGFDQYTDEGRFIQIPQRKILWKSLLTNSSLQPRVEARS